MLALRPAAKIPRAPLRHTLALLSSNQEAVMSFELWLGAIVALGILIYLFAVLARPERF